jgi:hypothetical protein
MLAIVRIALGRPCTFVVAALLIFLVGSLAALRMPVDIFPSIDIPIIASVDLIRALGGGWENSAGAQNPRTLNARQRG